MHQSQYILCLFVILSLSLSRVTICHGQSNETELDQGRDSDEDEDDYPDVKDKESSKDIGDFVGTNLFGDDACEKKCFSVEDMALLAARKEFEYLLPKDLGNNLFDEDSVEALLQYFYRAQNIIIENTKGAAKAMLLKAFYDALGGFLHGYMVPVSKFSFYAGLVTIKATERVIRLFQNCKTALNTYGIGWRDPIPYCKDFELGVDPLNISALCQTDRTNRNPCLNLNLEDINAENEPEMIVSLPKLSTEDPEYLTNIWLPFKRKRTFNLQSSFSAYVLVRYFVYVAKCYQYQNLNQDYFDAQFRSWLKINIEPHFDDDILYPGLGGVLRIFKATKDSKVIVRSVASAIRKDSKIHALNDEHIENEGNRQEKDHVAPDPVKRCKAMKKLYFAEKSKGTAAPAKSSDDEEELIDDSEPDEDDEGESGLDRKSKRKDMLMIILMILLILLIFIFLIAMITKYMRDLCKTNEPRSPRKKPEPKSQTKDEKRQPKADEKQGKSNKANERKKGGFSTFWTGLRSYSKLEKALREEAMDAESGSSSFFSPNRYRPLNSGGKTPPLKPILSESTTTATFCIVEDDFEKIVEPKLQTRKLNQKDGKWYCVSCQKHISIRDPIYIQNPYCPKEERKCARCACQVKSTQTLDVKPSKPSKYSFKNLFKTKREEAYGKKNLCSKCSEKISKSNPNCRRESDRCSSCCACCDTAGASCPGDTKDPRIDNPDGDKSKKNWTCVKCRKTIKPDDTIYFRNPFCPVDQRICNACRGKERSKLDCSICARPIKDVGNEIRGERKCDKCTAGGEFKIRKPQIRCHSCWRPLNEGDQFFPQPKNKVFCFRCYETKKVPKLGSILESNSLVEPNTLNHSFLKLDKCYPMAQWICTTCTLPIEKTDPIYYTRPSCPKEKRKCTKCRIKMMPKWICVTCQTSIETDDEIYRKDPKCPKNRRKCLKCREERS